MGEIDVKTYDYIVNSPIVAFMHLNNFAGLSIAVKLPSKNLNTSSTVVSH